MHNVCTTLNGGNLHRLSQYATTGVWDSAVPSRWHHDLPTNLACPHRASSASFRSHRASSASFCSHRASSASLCSHRATVVATPPNQPPTSGHAPRHARSSPQRRRIPLHRGHRRPVRSSEYLSFNPNAGSTTTLVCASRSFVELPRITRHAVTHGTQRTALVMAPTCTSETAKRPKEG